MTPRVAPLGLNRTLHAFHGLAPMASAPVKAFDQEGGSPFQANVTSLNDKSNCVAMRQGGEQLELNDQSVTK